MLKQDQDFFDTVNTCSKITLDFQSFHLVDTFVHCRASFIIPQVDVDEPSESENKQDQEQVKGDATTFERIDPTTFERINEVDNDLVAEAAEAAR